MAAAATTTTATNAAPEIRLNPQGENASAPIIAVLFVVGIGTLAFFAYENALQPQGVENGHC